MNSGYTKAACGHPGGWPRPSPITDALMMAWAIGGTATILGGVAYSLARAAGWA